MEWILRLRNSRVGAVEGDDRDRVGREADPGGGAGGEEERGGVLGSAFEVDRADAGLDSFAEAGQEGDLVMEGVGRVAVGGGLGQDFDVAGGDDGADRAGGAGGDLELLAVRQGQGRALLGGGGDRAEDVVAGQGRDEGVGGALGQALDRADLADRAGDDHRGAGGESYGVAEVVADEDRRQGERVEELAQLDLDLGAGVGVEGRERLVEQEDLGPAGEGSGEGDPLTLAAGEGAGPLPGEVGDPQALEQFVDAGRVGAGPEGDVLSHREVGEERVVLEDEANRPFLRRPRDARLRVEPGAVVEPDVTALGTRQAGDRAEDRRLPRARRADEGDRLRADAQRGRDRERRKGEVEVEIEVRHEEIIL